VNAAKRPGQPLLSVTIPTHNRARFLAELLECLLPQFAEMDETTAELVISDNASEDETAAVVAAFEQRGLCCRYLRNETNLGSDANFLACMRAARGQYVWVLGDDDLVMPNAIAQLLPLLERDEYELVYLSSVGFAGDGMLQRSRAEEYVDRLGRFAEVVTDGAYFLEKVNALIGLISAVVVNKNRLEATVHAPLEALRDSNLIQTGWVFPLVHRRMKVLYVWQRLLAYRRYNNSGWGVCEVFGVRLERVARKYFREEPMLTRKLMNGVLRYWMCDSILEVRRGRGGLNEEDFAAALHRTFARNWRYWVFVYPVARPPLAAAAAAHAVLAAVNRATRVAQGLRRHVWGHGRYVRP
jgi:glycosyltransferase involved in cell wall biosynthesis